MRVCLPIAEAPQGGMHSFFRNFRAYLAATGTDITDDIAAQYDALVVNSWAVRPRAVARAKRARPSLRVLHRIDGAAALYGRDAIDDTRQALVDLFADATVFQSAWGRGATYGRGIIGHDGPVIHNPVDIERFRPDGERATLPGRVRVAHVAFSTNARKGAPLVWTLARRRPDLQFVMVGRYDGAPGLDNLTLLGYADWDRLPAVLRACDVFLTFSENETCPNVVTEALASGLPVLYRDSGGTAELVGPCGTAVDLETFDRALEETLDRRRALGEAARARAVTCFRFEAIFPRYLGALQAAVRRPLPGPADYVRTLARVPPPARAVARWLATRARPSRAQPRGTTGPITVAWFLPVRHRNWDRMPASCWIRCLQLLPHLERLGIRSLVNDRRARADVAVFVRRQDPEARELAAAARSRGARVVFDLCVNYFDDTGWMPGGYGVTARHVAECRAMVDVADTVTAASAFIAERARQAHPRVEYLPDSVDRAHFRHTWSATPGRPLTAIWCGYSVKAAEAEPVMSRLDKRGIGIVVVSDARPALSVPFQFVRWRYATAPTELLQGDFAIAPRDLDHAYNRGHSFFRIGVFLAQGVPVLAGPVPSYAEILTPGVNGLVCATDADWDAALDRIVAEPQCLTAWSPAAVRAMEPYWTEAVARRHAALLRALAGRA